MRTNCIDSLDRTNFGQEMIGYRVCLMQLKQLGLSDGELIRFNSMLFKEVTNMYDEMGDQISLQYGGSIAHHAQLSKKKGFLAIASELVTSVKRHLANNFSDPYR